MSKSLGNVVDPYELLTSIGVNSIRTFFLKEGIFNLCDFLGPLLKDSNFDQDILI